MFKNEYKIIKKSGLFDEKYYLENYEDVRKADIDPIKHFIKYGWQEEKNPSAIFNTSFYLETNIDIKEANINPLLHYINHGWKEKRKYNEKSNFLLKPKFSKNQKIIEILKVVKQNPILIKSFVKNLKTLGLKKSILKTFYKVEELDTSINDLDNECIQLNKFKLLLNNTKKQIDIIIPIYNGYDFVVDCFNSILKYTDLTKHRLILVDDCSNEESLISFYETLKNLKYKNLNIILIKNSKNLGFIGSVNNGMRYQKNNDVILLNSDTVVTENWVEKMIQAAYSKENIGTVTALSNNATLCSIPNQWQDNEIPDGFDLDTFAQFVEFISPCEYPEIPSPVGFCMYIKRECLDKFGYFDTIYGKGYAEENDFGMRLYVNGYIHVCDDTTFIHHKGSMTFGNNPEKLEKIKKNADILYDRYPQLKDLLMGFEQINTMKNLYEILNIVLKVRNNPQNTILLVNVAPLDKFPSGALKHQLELISEFKNEINFLNFYSLDCKNIFMEIYIKEEKYKFYLGSYDWDVKDLNNVDINELFKNLLELFKISFTHFQTPQHFSLSLVEIAKNRGKVLFTLHDFLLYCPNYTLINEKNNFCNFESNIEKCNICLNKTISYKIDKNSIMKRREYIKDNLIKSVDLFISPSQSHKNLICKYLDLNDTVVRTIPHPFKLMKNEVYVNDDSLLNINKINIAFIGNFTEIKGSVYFKEIVLNLESNENINWFIVGKIHDWNSYNILYPKKNVTFYGEYFYDDIPTIIKKYNIHIAMNLSKCCESYSYTLTEAFCNNVLTIANNHGAVAERIKDNNNLGWIIGDDIVDSASKLIKLISKDTKLISSKIFNIRNELVEVKFDEYKEIYN